MIAISGRLTVHGQRRQLLMHGQHPKILVHGQRLMVHGQSITPTGLAQSAMPPWVGRMGQAARPPIVVHGQPNLVHGQGGLTPAHPLNPVHGQPPHPKIVVHGQR